jgi:hypothetical protein
MARDSYRSLDPVLEASAYSRVSLGGPVPVLQELEYLLIIEIFQRRG